MTMATPRRRYPASLSHNPSGPSRPSQSGSPSRPRAKAKSKMVASSVDDEVPILVDEPPPELASLEALLRQAGYKETRVFTPEAERVRPRLREYDEQDGGAAELADLYRSMGLDANAPIHVRHLTKPAVPFRSSSSVLRGVALQDASASINKSDKTEAKADSWWGTFRSVGKAAGNAANDSPEPSLVGLGLAKGGHGVRKTVSNWELSSPGKMDPETPTKPRERQPRERQFDWTGPSSLTSLFSPPQSANLMSRFGDEALASEDMYAYGMDDSLPSDTASGSGSGSGSASSSLTQDSPIAPSARDMSPPLLDAEDVFADLGLISQPAREEITDVGRRILASTVDYDDMDDELDTPPSPTSPSPVLPTFKFTFPTPAKAPASPTKPTQPTSPRKPESPASRVGKPESPRVTPRKQAPPPLDLIDTPTKSKIAARTAKPLRVAKSTPALGGKTRSRVPPVWVAAKTGVAPPTLQNAAPIICDSQSNAAVDLPPLPVPVMPESPPPTVSSFSTLTLKARKSLSALRAYWAAEEATKVEEPPLPSPDYDTLMNNANATAPVLTPRIDWEAQGFNAGWSTATPSFGFGGHKTTDSTDTMAEVGDPFLDSTGDIDYTKSFFYKPSTPPKDGVSEFQSRLGEPRRQRSIKSLKAALRMPVAPPVPPIPEKYKKKTSGSSGIDSLSRTPPIPAKRLEIQPPQLCIHSPGAYEDGRPARPIDLDGEEYAARDVVNNWGKGVRKGRGKRPAGSRSRVRISSYAWE